MPSITLADLGWTTPDGRIVLRGLDLAFSPERVGLVGRNGVGKTTLLHVLAGTIEPTVGTRTVVGSVKLMRQEVDAQPGATVADVFDVGAALAILRRAEAGQATIDEIADADWTLDERIRLTLAQVDLDADVDTPVAALSGGQRTRAALAAAIFAAPDFLLLDEPTNNLDRSGREAVGRLIESWANGLVVVSHDRELLERMDAIVEMTTLGAARYGGNWSRYRERKAIELEAAQQDLAHAEKQQADVQRKAQVAIERKARRDAAGSRKGARGDMPRILVGKRKNAAEASGGSGRRLSERLAEDASEAVAAARTRVEVLQNLSIVLPSTGLAPGRTVLQLRNVSGGYRADIPLFKNLDLDVIGADRIAIVGPNGAGKSTLLKLISGDLKPLAGEVKVSASLAMVDQHVAFMERDASILDNFRRLNPDASENACRAMLAGFLFRADAALQQVSTLSGGQLLRAGLACRLGGASPPQVLVLDEPTNHLDLDSIQAIEAASAAYDGALLVVSHDERFLTGIAVTRRLDLGRPPEPAS